MGTANFYVQESFGFLAAFRRTRLCFRRFQMRAWSHLNWQDFSKWFCSGLRWLLDKFQCFKLSGKGKRETVIDLECFINFFFFLSDRLTVWKNFSGEIMNKMNTDGYRLHLRKKRSQSYSRPAPSVLRLPLPQL